MSYSTNVPQPTFSTTGFVAPAESAILTGVQADQVLAFGSNLNPGLTTPQGQLAQSTTAIIADANSQFLALANNVDPAYAQGRYQDAIGRIYYMTRTPATATTLQVACVGLVGVVIPVGALVSDPLGNIYSCTGAGTIPNSGTVTLSFANQVTGPIAVPASVTIYQTIFGWNTATVASGIIGSNVETRAAFEARRGLSVAVNSVNFVQSVYGAVLAVPGVISASILENPTASPVTVKGVTLVANSIYVAVYGGDSTAIATAIWSKKAPGCAYNGNTTITVYDTNPAYSVPYPAYPVTFQIPIISQFTVYVVIASSTLIPSTATASIQTAVYNTFNGINGTQQLGIGATVYSSQFYASIAALGVWANIRYIYIDASPGNSTATTYNTFTGSISGTTLTISGLTGTAMTIGQDVFGAGVAPGTFVISGSGTTWQVAVSQTVASTTMTGACALNRQLTAIALYASQMPTLQAADVQVVVV